MKSRSALTLLGIFFVLTLFVPKAAFATGFVNSPLWISPANPKEGDKVTLSALFHNQEQDTISATIIFYDGTVLLAEKPVTLRSDEVGTISTTFDISAGSHIFSAATKNVAEVSATGSLEVIAVSRASVKLPMQFVPKEIVPAKASVKDAADTNAANGSSNAVLDKVDEAQAAVLDALPENAREKILSVTNSVDEWRAVRAENFSSSKIEAENKLAAEKAAKSANPGTKKVPSDAGPFTYLKYFVFSGLSFLFSSAIVFYLAAALILYLFWRFLFGRVRSHGKQKKPARSAKTTFHEDH